MSATTVNIPPVTQKADLVNVPVAAAKHLYHGALSYADVNGHATDVIVDETTLVLGVNEEEVDNSAGAAAALNIEIRATHCVQLTCSDSLTQADIGLAVYGVDNATVSTTGTGRPLVGYIHSLTSATKPMVRLAGLGQLVTQNLTSQVFAIPFTSLVVHDAMQTKLPGTAANDDMGLITGTPGTDAPTLQGVDFGGTTTDEKGSFEFVLPDRYRAGSAITVAVRGGMITSVADAACTVDVEAWKAGDDGAGATDLCATAAQSINSLTYATRSFTITPTGLVAGDKLLIRISFAGSDTANAAVMIPEISKLQVLLGTQH